MIAGYGKMKNVSAHLREVRSNLAQATLHVRGLTHVVFLPPGNVNFNNLRQVRLRTAKITVTPTLLTTRITDKYTRRDYCGALNSTVSLRRDIQINIGSSLGAFIVEILSDRLTHAK